MIDKTFIRVWLGNKPIDVLFQFWWRGFKKLHPDWNFVTITEKNMPKLTPELNRIYRQADSYAGRSDVIRLVALYELGGIYVDTDVMPLKSFEPLLSDQPFAGKRSKVAFESAVIGCPKGHKAMADLLGSMPNWVEEHQGRAASVQTGPAFISKFWFGRDDVTHHPTEYFYPYDGFMAPKRDEKLKLFTEKDFPEEMYAAHLSNHRWGGNPNKKK